MSYTVKSLTATFAARPVTGKASALNVNGDQAYSYAMRIAVVDRAEKEARVIEAGARSVTTSKHCNAIASALKAAGYKVERVESL